MECQQLKPMEMQRIPSITIDASGRIRSFGCQKSTSNMRHVVTFMQRTIEAVDTGDLVGPAPLQEAIQQLYIRQIY